MDAALLRVLDANFNRAREGLRVLEDFARFVLDDGGLSQRVKTLRHTLGSIAVVLMPQAALASRDVGRDVGTEISTAQERERTDAAHVAAAAAKRAAEAFRCIEEYGKVISPEAAARVERLRYELYAIEQDALVGGPRRVALRKARLCVLVTESLCRLPWLDVCKMAIDGGADVLQLREKELSDSELLDRAGRLREITASHGALLFINDRADIARLCDADGMHVGQDDLSVAAARSIAGHARLVGKSTHSVDELTNALAERPDYVAVGPMFASTTKPMVKTQGVELLTAARKLVEGPLVAIGGINEKNAGLLRAFAPVQLAVCQAVIASDNPREAAQGIRAAIET